MQAFHPFFLLIYTHPLRFPYTLLVQAILQHRHVKNLPPLRILSATLAVCVTHHVLFNDEIINISHHRDVPSSTSFSRQLR